MDIIGMGLEGLKKALEGMGNDRGKLKERRALFLTKDYPDIQALFNEFDHVNKRLEKQKDELIEQAKQQTDFMNKTHENAHEKCWGTVENLMKEKGLWPEDYNKRSNKEYLTYGDGCLFLEKREPK